MTALKGKRVVITRAPHQSAALAELLRVRGALPLLYPCIDIAPPQDTALLDTALRAAASSAFDWLVLTSANTAQAVANRLNVLNLNVPGLLKFQVAAVGSATAETARSLLGMRVSVIPEIFTADDLAATLKPAAGTRILLPQSALANDTLRQSLALDGARVTFVEAYQTILGSGGVNLPDLLAAGEVDAITLTSPSTVHNLLRRLELESENAALPDDVCIVCIGTKTAAAVRAQGLSVSAIPQEHTLAGLVAALEKYFT